MGTGLDDSGRIWFFSHPFGFSDMISEDSEGNFYLSWFSERGIKVTAFHRSEYLQLIIMTEKNGVKAMYFLKPESYDFPTPELYFKPIEDAGDGRSLFKIQNIDIDSIVDF